MRCSYDAENSGDFKREEFEAVEKAGYVEDLIAKLKVVLFADFQGKGPLTDEAAVLVIKSVGKTADHPAGSESDSKFGIKQENRFKFLDQRAFQERSCC